MEEARWVRLRGWTLCGAHRVKPVLAAGIREERGWRTIAGAGIAALERTRGRWPRNGTEVL